MNSLANISNSLEIKFDVNPVKSRISKAEKWFDKAMFDKFCRVIGLKSDGVLGLVLAA